MPREEINPLAKIEFLVHDSRLPLLKRLENDWRRCRSS